MYNVISGRRVVATRNGFSAREVALEYVRSLGCKRDEIIYYGADGVAWRARSIEHGSLSRALWTRQTPGATLPPQPECHHGFQRVRRV